MKGKIAITLILTMLLATMPAASFAAQETDASDAQLEIESIQTETETETITGDNDEANAGFNDASDVVDVDTDIEEAATEVILEEPESGEVINPAVNANAPADTAATVWLPEDFTYEYKSKLMYGCDYTRQLYVNGQVITGFSESGLEKLDPVIETTTTTDEDGEEKVIETIVEARGCTDLVIPSKAPDGQTIVGVGNNAFNGMHLTSVKFPTGMLVPYDDKVTNNVTRRGNFIIHESAFANNELTEVYLPAGVLGCMANSFQKNKIHTVTLPRTIWWIETLAFADNEISKINFPQTCDFRLEMHGMTFAGNSITSVRIPDYTEVINKDVFAMNPGMEPMTEEIAKKRSQTDWEKFMPGGEAESGIVYMYTDREALFDAQRIHTIDRPTKNQWSPFQKLILISDESPDVDSVKWTTADFTYKGTVVTGLSDSGIAKRETYTKMDIPDRTPSGEFVSEIAAADDANGGLFGAFDVVTLPNGLRKIGDRAFAGTGLKEIVFPNQLREIGQSAFRGNNLEDAIVSDSVVSIGAYAFADNPHLKNISIPHNNTYTVIAENTFGCSSDNGMTELTSIDIPDTITEIGVRAFAGNNFRSIEIPGSVIAIGEEAFLKSQAGNVNISITLAEGLESLGSRAFKNQTTEAVVVPKTLNALPEDSFEGSTTTVKIYVTEEEQYNNKDNFYDSPWHKIILSDPYTWTVEDFEFSDIQINGEAAVSVAGFSDEGLSKASINPYVTMPEENGSGIPVRAISEGAFKEKGIAGLAVEPDTIIQIGQNAFADNNLEELELGEGIQTISNNAFSRNNLKRVTLPASIRLIDEGAFANNIIDSVVFKEGSTAKLEIASNAFADNKMKSLQVCDNLDVLSGTAFADNLGMDSEPGVVRIYKLTESGSALEYKGNGKSTCQDIAFGEIPPELAPWGTRHFKFSGDTITGFTSDGEEKLKADPYVVLPGKGADGTVITKVGERAFYDYGGNKGVEDDTKKPLLKGVEFAPSITTIKMAAFQMCAIENLVVPDTVTVLEEAAFSSNYGMKSIELSEGLTEIPDGVFVTNATTMDMSTGVDDLVIPEGVTRIGKNAFRGQHIKNLTLPDSLIEIDEEAFMNHQITNLEIPASVKVIADRAFMVNQENSTPLPAELILHEGLESIGSKAFGQTGLVSVEIPSSLTSLAEDAFFDNMGMSGVNGRVIDLRTSVTDQSEGRGNYTNIAVKGINPKTSKEGGHRVVYDKMVGTGWSYDDFTYSADGSAITGWTDTGDQKRKEYAGKAEYPTMIMPDKASYDSDTYITEIGDNAFQLPLYNETTGEGEVTLQKFDCNSPYGIQRMVFPEKLEKIGACAFEYNNLKAVNLESAKSLTSIGTSAFHGNHLVTVTIPDSVNELGGGAFAMNNIFFLTLSPNVTKIPQGCFSMNIFMYEIEIPDTVTEIGEEAFAGARLETLDIPASVTKIGKKAFHLHHLKSLHIPGNVKYIDDSAFEGTFKDSTLTDLVIDEGVEYIGRYAFKEALLEEVDLPYSLKDMGVDPFYSNKGKDGSGVVTLYSKNLNHLKFNNDEYHGKENGVSKHYHQLIFNGNPITITFDVNGGMALENDSLTTNGLGIIEETLPLPEPGDLTNVAFIGWYTEKDGGEEVKVGSSFAHDVTIYAHWSDAPFVVDDAKTEAENDAAAAEESAAKIDEAATRDDKEKAAADAKADAEKAVESAEKAEQIAKEALRAAELEDEAGSTEATQAKVMSAKATLSAVQTAKAAANRVLASANGVIEQINNEKAAEAAEAERQRIASEAARLEAERQGTIDKVIPKVKAYKPKAAKTAITVKWKKLSKKQLKKSKATHYEIWVSESNSYPAGATKEKIVKKSKASWKCKGLKKNTKYYVRVRAIKYVNGQKITGKWSQKTIKTKKK